MISFPNAKINIGLNIIEKRPDSFHNIESVFYPIDLSDILEIVSVNQGDFQFSSTGLKIPVERNDNICELAWKRLGKAYKLPPVKIHLHKIIPMGAGLGGGSSDGAFTINMLNSIGNLDLSISEKEEIALSLGSDCPFFVQNKPSLATGRGEKLSAVDLELKGYYLFLVYPGIHISTQEAYYGVKPRKPATPLSEISGQPVSLWKNNVHNQFEETIFPNHPQIAQIKEELYRKGAIYAQMSGSGSSVYGIFEWEPKLKEHFSKYFTWSGAL